MKKSRQKGNEKGNMTKEKDKKVANEQLLLEASRLGNVAQLETILGQFQQSKAKKKTNPLAR